MKDLEHFLICHLADGNAVSRVFRNACVMTCSGGA